MSAPKIVNLKYPVETTSAGGGKVTVSSITLRRPKAKDLKFIPADGIASPADMLPLIASVSGLDIEVIEEVDLEDITEVVQALQGFSSVRPVNGSASVGA